MARKILIFTAVVALAFGCLAPSAQAQTFNTITFDPDGVAGGAIANVGSFDFVPGNALTTLLGPIAVGTQVQQNFQAQLNSVAIAGGGDVSVLGNNVSVVAQFNQTIVAAAPGTIVLGTGAAAPVNFIAIYQGGAAPDNLAGTGFNDGTLILLAAVTASAANFTNTGGAVPLDGFGVDNYPGQLSNTGFGGLTLTATIAFANSAYFLDVAAGDTLDLSFVNSSQILPFLQQDPSAAFVFGAPGAAPTAAGAGVPGQLGLNGTFGGTLPRQQVQADANASFQGTRGGVIPEPSTWVLSILGFAGVFSMGLARRWRKAA